MLKLLLVTQNVIAAVAVRPKDRFIWRELRKTTQTNRHKHCIQNHMTFCNQIIHTRPTQPVLLVIIWFCWKNTWEKRRLCFSWFIRFHNLHFCYYCNIYYSTSKNTDWSTYQWTFTPSATIEVIRLQTDIVLCSFLPLDCNSLIWGPRNSAQVVLSVIKHLVLCQIIITSAWRWRTNPKLLTLHQPHWGPGLPRSRMSLNRTQKVVQLGLGFQPWKLMKGNVKNVYNIV